MVDDFGPTWRSKHVEGSEIHPFSNRKYGDNYFHGGFSVAMLIFPNFSGWKLLRMDQYIRDTSEISHENIPYLI